MNKKLIYALIAVFCVGLFALIINLQYEFRAEKHDKDVIIIASKRPNAQERKEREENELKRNAPIDIPDASIVTIQQVKDKKKPTIAFFYVDWCGYCKRFMPIYGEVAKQYKNKYNFAVVHCEKPENAALVEEFSVHGYPSLYIIDKKINYNFSLSGNVTQDEEAFRKELDKYLNARKRFAK